MTRPGVSFLCLNVGQARQAGQLSTDSVDPVTWPRVSEAWAWDLLAGPGHLSQAPELRRAWSPLWPSVLPLNFFFILRCFASVPVCSKPLLFRAVQSGSKCSRVASLPWKPSELWLSWRSHSHWWAHPGNCFVSCLCAPDALRQQVPQAGPLLPWAVPEQQGDHPFLILTLSTAHVLG